MCICDVQYTEILYIQRKKCKLQMFNKCSYNARKTATAIGNYTSYTRVQQ